MKNNSVEEKVIECISQNIVESGGEVPAIKGSTSMFSEIAGFDSLRAIEVLIALEDYFKCELPLEKIFTKEPPGSECVNDIVQAVNRLVQGQ